jgi:hypothetical protein
MRFTFDGGMCGSFPGSRGELFVAALAIAFLPPLPHLDRTEGEHSGISFLVPYPKKAKRPASSFQAACGPSGTMRFRVAQRRGRIPTFCSD